MLRFDANLSLMYQEFPFLERFSAARADGFDAVEFQFPYEHSPAQIASGLRNSGLESVLFNAYPGDIAAGQWGLAALPGYEKEFGESIRLAIEYAKVLRTSRVHIMAGIAASHEDRALMRSTYVGNLKRACRQLAKHDIFALIEPINTRDVPGYFLHRQAEAHAILAEVNARNLKVQMDFYHMQITEGDLAAKWEQHRHNIGHVQIAGVPGRHEPDIGEINYEFLFGMLDRLGYDGWVGCEYSPLRSGPGGTTAGLGWLSRYRRKSMPSFGLPKL